MPEGIYLDALRLKPAELAMTMSKMMNDTYTYYDYFRWHEYYSFHFTGEDSFHREVCGLCELLNNKSRMHQTTVFNNLTQWWNEESPTFTDKVKKQYFFSDVIPNLILEADFYEPSANDLMTGLYNFVFT